MSVEQMNKDTIARGEASHTYRKTLSCIFSVMGQQQMNLVYRKRLDTLT